VAGVAQNVYDDEAFFAAYARLPRSVDGLEAAPEWPALRAMLPPLAGARVVDLGCGYGWFCRWAVDHGAAAVLGVDLSERMLARARADTADGAETRIAYERQDLDDVRLPAAAFELAYSSLTLHYLTELDRFLRRVHDALVPGGTFTFSAEHPIATAPSRPAFETAADGRTAWPLDRYLDEGPRTTDWLAPGVVKQHRTIGTYVEALLGAGFTPTRLVEWGPSPEQVAAHPEWAPEVERPPFLLMRCHSASASGSTRR
jgi:SAM-dependent methyltransferase